MTKVTLHYNLTRPLTDDDYTNLSALHSVYGISRVVPDPSGSKLTVDYDASRLGKMQVEAVIARQGLPLAVKLPGETTRSGGENDRRETP